MNRLILQFTAQLHLDGYSENSIQNHRLDLLRLQGWLAEHGHADERHVARLTREDIAEYQVFLAKRLRQRSINRHLSTLRLFFRFLETSGVAAANPMDQIVFPKIVANLPMLLLPSEVSQLLEAPLEDHYLGLRDRTLLELLYSTGIKLHELIKLDVEHLQLEAGLVRVGGRRQRLVPLTRRASELLKRYLRQGRQLRLLNEDDPCLFPGRNGTRISRVGVWKLIKRHARTAAITKNFSPRTLRHAFAIHLILGGMDLDAIKTLFGYRSLEATALYAHVNAPDFKAAYQAYHPLGKR